MNPLLIRRTWLVLLLSLFVLACESKKVKTPVVIISTEFGDMTFVLSDSTPGHTNNFLRLAGEGFYDSLSFHRIIRDFMIQTGDPKTRKNGRATLKDSTLIPAEFRQSLFHKKGALAAARHDNPAKASDPTQFYIVHGRKFTEKELHIIAAQQDRLIPKEQRETYMEIGGVPHLDQEYTVFGEMIDGFNTLEVIATTPTGPGDIPEKNIRIAVRLDTIMR